MKTVGVWNISIAPSPTHLLTKYRQIKSISSTILEAEAVDSAGNVLVQRIALICNLYTQCTRQLESAEARAQ